MLKWRDCVAVVVAANFPDLAWFHMHCSCEWCRDVALRVLPLGHSLAVAKPLNPLPPTGFGELE